MADWKYELTKASEPGFSFLTDTLDQAYMVLERFCCEICIKESKDDIYELLATSCGTEFWLED